MKNKDQIDTAAWEFFWKRTKKEVNDEGTRPDMVIGYREGYEQAIRDIEETNTKDPEMVEKFYELGLDKWIANTEEREDK